MAFQKVPEVLRRVPGGFRVVTGKLRGSQVRRYFQGSLGVSGRFSGTHGVPENIQRVSSAF